MLQSVDTFTIHNQIPTPLKLKSGGKKVGSGNLVEDKKGLRAAGSSWDVLLRKKADANDDESHGPRVR